MSIIHSRGVIMMQTVAFEGDAAPLRPSLLGSMDRRRRTVITAPMYESRRTALGARTTLRSHPLRGGGDRTR